MRKKRLTFKNFIAVFLVLMLAVSSAVSVYADTTGGTGFEEELPPEFVPEEAGTPILTLINNNAYEIEPGSENEIALRFRNTGTSRALMIIAVPKAHDLENNPFTVSIDSPTTNLGSISANSERTINLIVKADRTAASKTYAFDIDFTYRNRDEKIFESTTTVYFKVKNSGTKPVFTFENYKLNPDSISAGENVDFNFDLINKGPLDMYEILVTLENLDPQTLGVRGVSQKKYRHLKAGTRENVGFTLTTNPYMDSGNYPLTVKITYNDENGTTLDYSEDYYIPVGTGTGSSTDIRIENIIEPSGNYGINKNFNVGFEVKNYGESDVEDIKIAASEYGGGGNIVPKSTNVFSLDKLEAGESVPYTFTFAATGEAESKNHTIEFTVSFMRGSKEYTINQYAGVNITNADGDKESKPKIIVSEYSSDPVIVMAGETFDLTMTFLNTHYDKAVKNVKMYLTMVAETSSDNNTSGNVFTPVNSSNTFYYDRIEPKGTAEKTMTLYTVPSAQPKTYTLTVNFEYEDENGNEYTATELLGINVKQISQIDTSEFYVPESMELYMPMSIYFDIYNTGKVDVNNLKVLIEGDVDTQNKSTYIGNCAPGESNYYEGSFSLMNVGTNNVKVVISYEDTSGEEIRVEKEYTIEGVEPFVPDMPMDDMGMMPEEEGGKLSKGAIAGIGAGAVVIIAGAAAAIKIRKKKKAAELIDDDEE